MIITKKSSDKPVASSTPSFQNKLAQLRQNRQQVYEQMKAQAEDAETIAYYEHKALPDIDLNIVDPL